SPPPTPSCSWPIAACWARIGTATSAVEIGSEMSWYTDKTTNYSAAPTNPYQSMACKQPAAAKFSPERVSKEKIFRSRGKLWCKDIGCLMLDVGTNIQYPPSKI